MNFFSWLKNLFSRKPKVDWNNMPYKQGKYEELNINERNQV